MTPEEFADKMRRIRDDERVDTPQAHKAADNLLCRVLVELGYGEGVKIFKEVDKWYS